MSLSKERIQYLLKVFTEKTASEEEEREMLDWIKETKGDAGPMVSGMREYMYRLWQEYQPGEDFSHVDWNAMLSAVMQKEKAPSVTPKIRSMRWIRVAAAAVIILGLGAGAYFLFGNKHAGEIAKSTIEKPLANDKAAPTGNKAVLILADGRQIELDSAGNGTLAMQGNMKLIKQSDGQIAYKGNSDEVMYNTLSNPKGSKVITLTLSDGSKVWLNAESSLQYPTVFTGNERKVEITGEAYFEVAHNAAMPFIVSKGETSVQVLGTHFNVNAYDDESEIRVTLLEGSVKVTSPSLSERDGVRLKPGQQARVGEDNQIKVVNDVDLDAVIAWQKGLFVFSNTDLATIMRQVSRWYNVEVVYDGKITDTKFGGGLSKSLPLSNVLKLLEANGVKFQLEGKVLRVTAPYPPKGEERTKHLQERE